MRELESITGHVIYNPAYTCKFQLKPAHVAEGSTPLPGVHRLSIFKIRPNTLIGLQKLWLRTNFSWNLQVYAGL